MLWEADTTSLTTFVSLLIIYTVMKDRYTSPDIEILEYSIEEGFRISDVETPDFENENEL